MSPSRGRIFKYAHPAVGFDPCCRALGCGLHQMRLDLGRLRPEELPQRIAASRSSFGVSRPGLRFQMRWRLMSLRAANLRRQVNLEGRSGIEPE